MTRLSLKFDVANLQATKKWPLCSPATPWAGTADAFVSKGSSEMRLRHVAGIAAWLLAMWSSLGVADASAAGMPDYRKELRPSGDFKEQVYVQISRVKLQTTEEVRCDAASGMGHLFWWINDRERNAIEDKMIDGLVGLLDEDMRGGGRCVSYFVAGILGVIGSRARAAIPSLERALRAAEVEREKHPPPEFDIAFEHRLDYVFRRALVNIDGEDR